MSSNLIIRHFFKIYLMSSKKYKTLRSIYIVSKLNHALKKSVFIGFFQLKSLDFENSIQIKQLTFGLNLKTFICKNSFLKQNKLLPSPLLSSIPQGPIVILYSFSKPSNFDVVNKMLSKTKLVPLLFCFENKFMYLKTLLSLSNVSKTDLYIQLISLLNNHNIKINNIFIFSNSNIQTLLRI